MPRERKLQAFILRRLDYGEADQIITLFTREEGKLRALVKAAKLPTSKLQPLLQPLFHSKVTITAGAKEGGLGKVISVELIKAYSGILAEEAKLNAWYVVSELLLKALPDSQPNEALFEELQAYAEFLHASELTDEQIKHSVIQFEIKALRALGLGIRVENPTARRIWFSFDRGGFFDDDSVDALPIQPQVLESFLVMSNDDYQAGKKLQKEQLERLPALVSKFVSHQLEREIKSQRLLT